MKPPRLAPDGVSARRAFGAAAAAGFAAIFSGIGIGRFAFPALIPVLVLHGWFSGAAADYLASLNLFGYVVGAFAAGELARRLPVGATARLAMAIVPLSYLLCAWPGAFWWFGLWRFLAGAAAACLMVAAIPAVLAQVAEERRARVNGIIFTGIGAGMVLGGFLVPALARRGLNAAWIGIGAVAVAVMAASWRHWRFEVPINLEGSGRRIPLSGRFDFLLATYCLAAFALAPVSLYWVDWFARGMQLGVARAAHYWVMFGVAGIVGPLAAGAIAEQIGNARGMLLWFGLLFIAVALPLHMRKTAALVAASVLAGTFGPSITALASGRVMELVTKADHAPAWGRMTVAFALLYAGSSWLMAAIFARTGSYRLPFELAATAAALAAALLAFN